MRKYNLVIFALAAIMLLALVGCDSRSVDTPDYHVESLIASPATILADGDTSTTSEIRALVVNESGTPVSGVTVTFKSDNRIGAVGGSATTDNSGLAVVNFDDNGAAPQTVTLRALVGSSSATANVTITELPTYHISSLTVHPDEIVADDDDATFAGITVEVMDNDNNPAESQQVELAIVDGYTQYGTVGANTAASSNALSLSLTTDANGKAYARFWDNGTMADSVKVQATLGADMMVAKLKITNTPYEIVELTATPASIAADNDDATYTTIKAVVINPENNNSAVEGENVFFSCGVLGNIAAIATTSESGVATARFYDNGQAGLATIKAQIGGSTKSKDVEIYTPATNHLVSLTNSGALYADGDNNTFGIIEAVVENSEGEPVANQSVSFSIAQGYSAYGSLSATTATTNGDGVATVNFFDNGISTDTVVVKAYYNNENQSTNFAISSLPIVLSSIVATPDTIYADADNTTNSSVYVVVNKLTNGQYYPEPNISITFRVEPRTLGSVTGTVVTDESGIATATFKDNGSTGSGQIIAMYGDATISTDITVDPVPAYNIVAMTADPTTIYADNNITYSNIRVTVKDDDGFAVTDERVRFRSDIGTVWLYADTDSTGVAKSIFYDSGDIGTATIEAYVGNTHRSIQVQINETPDLDPNQCELIVGTSNTTIDLVTQVKARIRNELGDNVPNGTIVTFDTSESYGFFQDSEEAYLGETAAVQTLNGVATVWFNAGTLAGTTTITATVDNNGTPLTMSNDMVISPGVPSSIVLSHGLNPAQVDVNGPEIPITAKVMDLHGNHVLSGINVAFTTTIGTIESNKGTNANGEATVMFSPGNIAGNATINAQADSAKASTTISVISDAAASIEFNNPSQVEINPRGSGGIETRQLRVNIYDMSGNPVDESQEVYFRLNYAPDTQDGGANINNEAYWIPGVGIENQEFVSASSSNGQAVVSINSGWASGTITVEAWVYTDEEQTNKINAVKSNIVVTSGPPADVNVTLEDHSTGEDMGGGFWRVEFGALLTDENNNPVSYGTAVSFSVRDEEGNPINWASVVGSSYVGNINADGDSLEGTAYSKLIFHGSYTNETVKIKVSSGTFTGEDEITLPIQSPQIDMVLIPQHVDWDNVDTDIPINEDDEDDTDEDGSIDEPAIVRIVVTDGQNTPVNKQLVTFMSTLGEFLPQEDAFAFDGVDMPEGAYEGLTGYSRNGEYWGGGRLDKEVRFEQYECPPPANGVPGQTTATITVSIVGTNTSNNITVQLIRYY